MKIHKTLFLILILCTLSTANISLAKNYGWSSSEDQIRNAKCKKDIPSANDIDNYIEGLKSGVLVTKTILGQEFKDQDENILDLFTLLVTKKDRIGRALPFESQIQLDKLTNCSSVL